MMTNGPPGEVAPTSTDPGVSMRTRYQMIGESRLRCGSFARIGAPVAVRLPLMAKLFDASGDGARTEPRLANKLSRPGAGEGNSGDRLAVAALLPLGMSEFNSSGVNDRDRR